MECPRSPLERLVRFARRNMPSIPSAATIPSTARVRFAKTWPIRRTPIAATRRWKAACRLILIPGDDESIDETQRASKDWNKPHKQQLEQLVSFAQNIQPDDGNRGCEIDRKKSTQGEQQFDAHSGGLKMACGCMLNALPGA
jgi:hypothetical protein